MSPQCQQLNRLFSQCVDGNRIKVPQDLEDPPEPAEGAPPFILDVLHDAATAIINTIIDKDLEHVDSSDAVMDLLASRDKIAISEFELIQLMLRACERKLYDFRDYAQFFNYAALSNEQQAWLLSKLPPSKNTSSLVKNGLLQSDLVDVAELRHFKLNSSRLHWKSVFNSGADRMGRFLSATTRSLELFHKKLIILQPDDRLVLMIFVPQKVPRASEFQVDATVRVFALPRSSGHDSVNYRVMPTRVNYRLYCDENIFQLYQTKRRDTFIFLIKGPVDGASFQNTKADGDRRRQKQVTIDDRTNFDCRASVALNKISASIQRHVGQMNRAGIRAAVSNIQTTSRRTLIDFAKEVYVISNRDVESMRLLDEWLHYIDTEEVLPLFASEPEEYRVPTLRDFDRDNVPTTVAEVVWKQDLSRLSTISNLEDIHEILHLLNNAGQKSELHAVYTELLQIGISNQTGLDKGVLLRTLLDFLPDAVFLTQLVLESELWKACRDSVLDEASDLFPSLLKELILCVNRLRAFVKQAFRLTLQELKQMTMQNLSELVELISLSVEQPDSAMELLIECIEPETTRLIIATPLESQQFAKCLIGIALDHIDEANSNQKFSKQTLRLQKDGVSDGFEVVKCSLRIDATEGPLKVGDHVRFVASVPPQNAPLDRPYAMDAIVISSRQSSASFRCIHHPPPFLTDCTWQYKHCGSFVTAKAMLDAVTTFYTEKEASCKLYGKFVGLRREMDGTPDPTKPVSLIETLNASQNAALVAAMQYPLVFIWGPPGTGKTHTIVVILKRLLETFSKSRFLVTAPTHNAVDNILQHFIRSNGAGEIAYEPLRVSTSVSHSLGQ